jgi:hypothetical protein
MANRVIEPVEPQFDGCADFEQTLAQMCTAADFRETGPRQRNYLRRLRSSIDSAGVALSLTGCQGEGPITHFKFRVSSRSRQFLRVFVQRHSNLHGKLTRPS